MSANFDAGHRPRASSFLDSFAVLSCLRVLALVATAPVRLGQGMRRPGQARPLAGFPRAWRGNRPRARLAAIAS
jgi:hypothetical protein